MEFHEKLQELRKQRGLTQEDLAASLYVSRAAVSKWESGRGYPSVDSLKAIAGFFSVTIDELLSGAEVLTAAEEDRKEKERHIHDLVFGVLDCSAILLFFLPFFGQKSGSAIEGLSLPALTAVAPWLRAAYAAITAGMIVWGIVTLALQNCRRHCWEYCSRRGSLLLNAAGAFLFIISLQPYAAVYLFVFLVIKVLLLIKWR